MMPIHYMYIRIKHIVGSGWTVFNFLIYILLAGYKFRGKLLTRSVLPACYGENSTVKIDRIFFFIINTRAHMTMT